MQHRKTGDRPVILAWSVLSFFLIRVVIPCDNQSDTESGS